MREDLLATDVVTAMEVWSDQRYAVSGGGEPLAGSHPQDWLDSPLENVSRRQVDDGLSRHRRLSADQFCLGLGTATR